MFTGSRVFWFWDIESKAFDVGNLTKLHLVGIEMWSFVFVQSILRTCFEAVSLFLIGVWCLSVVFIWINLRLRTTYSEICTCQHWFCRDDHNFLAIGHRSGTLILICLPSGKPGANHKVSLFMFIGLNKSGFPFSWNNQFTTMLIKDTKSLVFNGVRTAKLYIVVMWAV